MKRRTLTLVGSAALMLALFAGIAVAQNFIDCPNASNFRCFGTDGQDEMDGTGEGDVDQLIEAGANSDTAETDDGNDTMRGRRAADGKEFAGSELEFDGAAGNDFIDVGPGNDHEADGDSGNDTIQGGDGNDGARLSDGSCDIDEDSLRGETGQNTVGGGAGDDCIDAASSSAAAGEEWIFGGTGNDFIAAQDEKKDTIRCGDGTDVVFFDEGLDSIERCEFRNPENPTELLRVGSAGVTGPDTGPIDDDN